MWIFMNISVRGSVIMNCLTFSQNQKRSREVIWMIRDSRQIWKEIYTLGDNVLLSASISPLPIPKAACNFMLYRYRFLQFRRNIVKVMKDCIVLQKKRHIEYNHAVTSSSPEDSDRNRQDSLGCFSENSSNLQIFPKIFPFTSGGFPERRCAVYIRAFRLFY
jgi:hypothetical protein